MKPREIKKVIEFMVTSLFSLAIHEKVKERSCEIAAIEIQKIKAKPARCHGVQSPRMLNSKVIMPNSHKTAERTKLIMVKTLAFFILTFSFLAQQRTHFIYYNIAI